MSNHVRIRDAQRKGSRAEHTPRNRKQRPKTFKSEELAKKWAQANDVKDYTLVNLKSDLSGVKKIRVEVKE